MPKEVKQRGRRGEKARKESTQDEVPTRNQRLDQEEEYRDTGYSEDHERIDRDGQSYASGSNSYAPHYDGEQTTFFGLLDEQEVEYFKQAESTLSVDAFGSSEERRGFVLSVIEETRGKELKLVTNHIGSRLCERLVLLANDAQLLRLFKAFSGNYSHLVKNKFSSHVVETLLAQAAPLIEREILDPQYLENVEESAKDQDGDNDSGKSSIFGHDKVESIESLFLGMVDEIKPVVRSLPEHQYASHFLRLLLLILAGKPVPSATESKSALRSRRSKAARKKIILGGTQAFSHNEEGTEQVVQVERTYQVPKSFSKALDEILIQLLKDLDTSSAREMSIHAIASPVIQLVLGIECDRIADSNPNPQKIKIPTDTFLSVLFPYSTHRQKKLVKEGKSEHDNQNDKQEKEESKKSEESFVEYLLSDAIGSHLLEAVIDVLPVKLTSRLADNYMVGRIGKLVRRQESGNYVVQALLRKMSGRKDIASKIMDELIGEIRSKLFSSNDSTNEEGNKDQTGSEMNYGLARTIIEVSQQALGGYKCDEVIDVILEKYDPKKDGSILTNLLGINAKRVKKDTKEQESFGSDSTEVYSNAMKMQKALLLQEIMSVSPSVSEIVLEGLITLGDASSDSKDSIYLKLGRDSIFSHVFEKALVVTTASKNTIQRRRLLNHLSKSEVCCGLAANVYGSHVVDAMVPFCFRLKFFRERIAEELIKQESEIKMTPYGRSVWKNWKLDDYLRRRRDWWNKVKEQEDQMSETLGVEKKDSRSEGPKVSRPKAEESKDFKKNGSGKSKHAPFNKQHRPKIY